MHSPLKQRALRILEACERLDESLKDAGLPPLNTKELHPLYDQLQPVENTEILSLDVERRKLLEEVDELASVLRNPSVWLKSQALSVSPRRLLLRDVAVVTDAAGQILSLDACIDVQRETRHLFCCQFFVNLGLYLTAKYRIADIIQEHEHQRDQCGLDVAKIASEAKLPHNELERILRALTAKRVFTETNAGCFANTPLSLQLLKTNSAVWAMVQNA